MPSLSDDDGDGASDGGGSNQLLRRIRSSYLYTRLTLGRHIKRRTGPPLRTSVSLPNLRAAAAAASEPLSPINTLQRSESSFSSPVVTSPMYLLPQVAEPGPSVAALQRMVLSNGLKKYRSLADLTADRDPQDYDGDDSTRRNSDAFVAGIPSLLEIDTHSPRRRFSQKFSFRSSSVPTSPTSILSAWKGKEKDPSLELRKLAQKRSSWSLKFGNSQGGLQNGIRTAFKGKKGVPELVRSSEAYNTLSVVPYD